jgi:hypothetical protein
MLREVNDRGGALGTLGYELVGNCVVVWQRVEQSQLFPNVCNRWVPITVACWFPVPAGLERPAP